MFCIKCGADNLESASFCRKCGAAVDEVATRVATRPADGVRGLVESPADAPETSREPIIFEIYPTLKFVKAGYVGAAAGALLIAGLSGMFTSIPPWAAVIVGLLLFLIPAFAHFKKRLTRYTLTDSTLEIDEGFVSRSRRSVPIRRIQDVTVANTVSQRLLGVGDLMIDNASDEGGKVVLKNIDSPKLRADLLLNQMRRLEGPR